MSQYEIWQAVSKPLMLHERHGEDTCFEMEDAGNSKI
jgi:hypothetical protein